jgi:hypothetical protein
MFSNPLPSPIVGRRTLIKFSLILINCIFGMHSHCPLLTLSFSFISTFIHSVVEHFLFILENFKILLTL